MLDQELPEQISDVGGRAHWRWRLSRSGSRDHRIELLNAPARGAVPADCTVHIGIVVWTARIVAFTCARSCLVKVCLITFCQVRQVGSIGVSERSMDNLKKCSLDELIRRVLKERLIDACERKDDRVVIVQGATRFVLNPSRAHAFLRGVIKGMSIRQWRDRTQDDRDATPQEKIESALSRSDVPPEIMKSFREHLLTKWWSRYEKAGCPFGRTDPGLKLWVQHNTSTTAN